MNKWINEFARPGPTELLMNSIYIMHLHQQPRNAAILKRTSPTSFQLVVHQPDVVSQSNVCNPLCNGSFLPHRKTDRQTDR